MVVGRATMGLITIGVWIPRIEVQKEVSLVFFTIFGNEWWFDFDFESEYEQWMFRIISDDRQRMSNVQLFKCAIYLGHISQHCLHFFFVVEFINKYFSGANNFVFSFFVVIWYGKNVSALERSIFDRKYITWQQWWRPWDIIIQYYIASVYKIIEIEREKWFWLLWKKEKNVFIEVTNRTLKKTSLRTAWK